MPASYVIDKQRRLVITTVTGAFILADALAHQESLCKDQDFGPSFSQLMDLTQVTEYALTEDDLHKLAQRRVFSEESRRAIVVDGDLGYGLSRMFGMLRENAGELGIRIFRNRDEALDWVLPKKTSA